MNRKAIALAIVALGSAVWASAQAPGGHSNAPTDKDYRLTIAEPKDGASITGPDVTIVLALPRLPDGQTVNQRERSDVMTPTFQIWVDGKDFGNLPGGQNVFTARGLSYGPHKITVAAKNTAGELVERKEIGITTVAPAVVETRMTEAPAVRQPAPPPPPVAPVAEQAPPPAPAPSAPYVSPAATLPATGSSYPAAAAAGLGLIVTGLVLRRRGL